MPGLGREVSVRAVQCTQLNVTEQIISTTVLVVNDDFVNRAAPPIRENRRGSVVCLSVQERAVDSRALKDK
jgi:hypothetical protein